MTAQTQYDPRKFPPGLLAVPATEWMWTRSVNSLIGLLSGLPPGSGVQINQRSSSAADNRNMLVESFLAGPPSHQWILFVDSDMTPEPFTIPRLLSHNVDVVGALYYSRDGQYQPMYGELADDRVQTSAEGLRKVAWVGTGCLLVKRSVLEVMDRPYMEFLAPGMAEDVYFCAKAGKLGFSVYVDTALCAGHMSAEPIDREAAMLHQQLPRVQALRNAEAERKRPEYEAAARRLEEVSRAFDKNGIRVNQAPRA